MLLFHFSVFVRCLKLQNHLRRFFPGDKWLLCCVLTSLDHFRCVEKSTSLQPYRLSKIGRYISLWGYSKTTSRCRCNVFVSHGMAGNDSPPPLQLLPIINSYEKGGIKGGRGSSHLRQHVSEVCMCSCSIEKDSWCSNLYAVDLRHLHLFGFQARTLGHGRWWAG